LKENGTATVAELAKQLGMAQVSVRHHLDILMGEDLVEAAGVRRHDGAGRPSQVYALTPEAAKLFPQRHDVLADGMLTELKALLTARELRDLLARLAEKAVREAPSATPNQSIEERLEEVTDFLTGRGYNARWELRNGRYELYACNCPYVGVADHHPELCLMDQAMIQHLVPEAMRIETRATDGSSHCTYVIGPAEPANSP
jgi:predicted ArsR family transcriptional regulator